MNFVLWTIVFHPVLMLTTGDYNRRSVQRLMMTNNQVSSAVVKSAGLRPGGYEHLPRFNLLNSTAVNRFMDPDATRPITTGLVIYRCSCGNEFQVDPAIGGACASCSKRVTPKALGHDLGQTMTILDGSFELNQTKIRGELDQSTQVDHAHDRQSDEDPEILIGEQYGHFELVSTLGRGGMGQVYRALDTSLQRYVAVKILRSGIGTNRGSSRSSESEVDKLLQEAVSQARVTHPNIVTIYYVGKQDDDPFLAMELVNGKPLCQRIEEGDIPFSEIAEVALQICDALKYSYELDIVHGDIKPSNVLLQTTGHAKLSDFGMARRVSKSDERASGGTPNYIAPELLRGETPSIQSDMYALGVTLYEMSFGESPVELTGRTVPEWLTILDNSQLEFPTAWPDHLPEDWRALLKRLLAKDPSREISKLRRVDRDTDPTSARIASSGQGLSKNRCGNV
jgi:hypothetical protein